MSSTTMKMLCGVSLLAGCAGPEAPDADVQDETAALYACEESAFGAVQPLTGPGYDEEIGLLEEPQKNYVVSSTMLYWRAEATKDFYAYGARLLAQLDATPGVLAYTLGTDDGCRAARSIAIWESEEAMYEFVLSGAHAEAMTDVHALSVTGKAVHWRATAEELDDVSWETANARLAEVAPSRVYDR